MNGIERVTSKVSIDDVVEGNAERRLSIGVIMGSDSDLKIMRHTGRALMLFGLVHGIDYEERVVSAHRTPEWMANYSRSVDERGIEIIVAGAGGSAHLPGMVESLAGTSADIMGVAITDNPDVMNRALGSMIGMPEGTPLAVMGQNASGAFNAGLRAIQILAKHNPILHEAYCDYKVKIQTEVHNKDARLQELGADAYLAAQVAVSKPLESDYYF